MNCYITSRIKATIRCFNSWLGDPLYDVLPSISIGMRFPGVSVATQNLMGLIGQRVAKIVKVDVSDLSEVRMGCGLRDQIKMYLFSKMKRLLDNHFM